VVLTSSNDVSDRCGTCPPVIRAGRHRGEMRSAAVLSETTCVTADDGTALHAEIHGDRTASLTVLLCHGYTLDSASWQAQVSALAERARVVVWDHRGHGRSETGPADHLTVDQLGRDVLAVMDQTARGTPVVVAGHSMGGMAVLAFAEQHPEMFGSRVAGVPSRGEYL
jgi:pimeloyl-ACP methyl ester carboxylesterase